MYFTQYCSIRNRSPIWFMGYQFYFVNNLYLTRGSHRACGLRLLLFFVRFHHSNVGFICCYIVSLVAIARALLFVSSIWFSRFIVKCGCWIDFCCIVAFWLVKLLILLSIHRKNEPHPDNAVGWLSWWFKLAVVVCTFFLFVLMRANNW